MTESKVQTQGVFTAHDEQDSEIAVSHSCPWLSFSINSGNSFKSNFLDLHPPAQKELEVGR